MPKENKYGNAPAKTLHDLKKNHEDKQQKDSVNKIDLSIKTNLSKKATDELLDEIRE